MTPSSLSSVFTASLRRPRWSVLALVTAGAIALPSWADKADRGQPLAIEADKPGTVDLIKQVVVFNGNVVITQGTMTIRAEQAEVREGTDGYRIATAIGTPGTPASFRQKREIGNEFIEGHAARIEYDGRTDVVRFIGDANVRRLRGGVPADEITGSLITYDNIGELFSVQGGNNPAAANGGRVRAVLTPREKPGSPAAGASAPAGAAPAASSAGERP